MQRIFKNIIKQGTVLLACTLLFACGKSNKVDLEYLQSKLVKPLQYPDDIEPVANEGSSVIPDLPAPKQALQDEDLQKLIRPPSLLGPLDVRKQSPAKKGDKS